WINKNQDKATKPQTVQIVRQGEVTLYRFKFNSLYIDFYRFSDGIIQCGIRGGLLGRDAPVFIGFAAGKTAGGL
ncbi:hypothetical protein, partial [Neisseria meningitidis]|uniref:hypothetical protein n=1 Tax=Neisseria meningitidis TaxID=487 RepID=UPI001E3B0880